MNTGKESTMAKAKDEKTGSKASGEKGREGWIVTQASGPKYGGTKVQTGQLLDISDAQAEAGRLSGALVTAGSAEGAAIVQRMRDIIAAHDSDTDDGAGADSAKSKAA